VPLPEDITRHHEWTAPDGDDFWIDGPPTPEPVSIVAYDPSWPEQFRVVAARIREALGDNVLALEHVGSTAVPGISAKPVTTAAGELVMDYNQRKQPIIREIYARMFPAHGLLGSTGTDDGVVSSPS
jgi:hypothetical protein